MKKPILEACNSIEYRTTQLNREETNSMSERVSNSRENWRKREP
jgi:hypothetical protein